MACLLTDYLAIGPQASAALHTLCSSCFACSWQKRVHVAMRMRCLLSLLPLQADRHAVEHTVTCRASVPVYVPECFAARATAATAQTRPCACQGQSTLPARLRSYLRRTARSRLCAQRPGRAAHSPLLSAGARCAFASSTSSDSIPAHCQGHTPLALGCARSSLVVQCGHLRLCIRALRFCLAQACGQCHSLGSCCVYGCHLASQPEHLEVNSSRFSSSLPFTSSHFLPVCKYYHPHAVSHKGGFPTGRKITLAPVLHKL